MVIWSENYHGSLSPDNTLEVVEKKMPENILVLTTCYPLSNMDISAIFLKSLYQAMLRTGKVQVTVLAADHEDVDSYFDNQLVKQGLKIKRYRYFFRKWQILLYGDAALSNINRNPLSALLLPPLLLSLFFHSLLELVRGKYSIIHAHWSLPTGLIAVILGKIFNLPVMVTSHGGDVYGLRGSLNSFLQKWVFSEADIVNAVSSPVMKEIKSLAPQAHVMVKSMGVDEDLFCPVDDAKFQLGIANDSKVLLFVGRFSEKKGVEYLLEAAEILKQEINDFQILLIGKGNLEEKIRKIIEEKKLWDVVSIIGMVENSKLPIYYSAADLLVVPSVVDVGGQEGLPVTIMEGLLCGKKIVTTKVGGIVELSGLKSIFFSEQRNGKNLAKVICQALEDETVLPNESREEGMRFSINRVASDFIDFYKELLK